MLAEATPLPTQSDLGSFLGMCTVYRRFVNDFSKIAALLTSMLNKEELDLLPELDGERRYAFETSKTCQISPQVLRLPRQGLPYSVDMDGSGAQLGCTLLQKHQDRNIYPSGFWFRTLSSAERSYSTTEKEC